MALINSKVKELSRIGDVLSKRLERLGIITIKDLIYYFPFRYEDYSSISKIGDIRDNGVYTVEGELRLLNNKKTWKRKMVITEAVLADDTGEIKVIWFNQPYLKNTLKMGARLRLSGKVALSSGSLGFVSPSHEIIREKATSIHTGRVVPIYPLTDGLTQKQFRFLVHSALKCLNQLQDKLPQELKDKHNLLDLILALGQIHFPQTDELLAEAKKRLKYDELLNIIFEIVKLKKLQNSTISVASEFKEKEIKEFVKSLDFELTDDQKKVSWKILQEIQKTKAMNRFVQGDVGSGKTIIAIMAILNNSLNNFGSAVLAPTEVLAKQHFNTFTKLLKNFKIPILLFTASTKEFFNNGETTKVTKKQAELILKQANNLVAIGTHSLIQNYVEFSELTLIIVDEQHRFGVEQRGELRQKVLDKQGVLPHYLALSATPIPRSLTLTLYGDLDISLIKQMPKGRKKVITKIVGNHERKECYEFMKTELKKGKQIFVICPLIDVSDKLQVKSVNEEYENLKNKIFTNFVVGFLHGKMKPKEKDEIMNKFKNGEINVLVSTSVIEVGVDIPNASIMVIEGAERFGLAQLHQFRGRVGRNDYQSYCFLFTTNISDQEKTRLKCLEKTNDGFKLAEYDLEIRGPGELYGVRQSGKLNLQLNSLFDVELIEQVKEDVDIYFDKLVDGEFGSGKRVVLGGGWEYKISRTHVSYFFIHRRV